MIKVTNHAVDRYIERSGKKGLGYHAAKREILSPRVVAAAERGLSRWRDPWTGLVYCFADKKLVSIWIGE